jgi:uncharacterized membrane protein
MIKAIDRKRNDVDWKMLKLVVAALWVTAGITFVLAYFAAPQGDDIVLGTSATPAAPLHLAGSAAR